MKIRNTFTFLFAAALIGGSFAALAMEKDQKQLDQALCIAADTGNLDKLKRLIEEGANVDCENQWGWTALMKTAASGHIECLCILLNAKADPNILRKSKRSALMQAAESGHHEIVRLLINAKAELDMQDINGRTALMLAATHRKSKCIRLLIAANANINVLDKDGRDAVTCAYQWSNIKNMNLLIDAGADLRPIVKRHASWTPKPIMRSINVFQKRKKEAYALLWCIKQFAQDSICDKDLGLLIAEPLLTAYCNHKEMLSEAIELEINESDKIALRAALNAEPNNNESN